MEAYNFQPLHSICLHVICRELLTEGTGHLHEIPRYEHAKVCALRASRPEAASSVSSPFFDTVAMMACYRRQHPRFQLPFVRRSALDHPAAGSQARQAGLDSGHCQAQHGAEAANVSFFTRSRGIAPPKAHLEVWSQRRLGEVVLREVAQLLGEEALHTLHITVKQLEGIGVRH